MSGGLLPCGTLTMPMILKFVPPTATVDPVASLFCAAYPESTSASSAAASAAVRAAPEVSLAELSEPRAVWARSTPSTVNEPVVKLEL